LCKSFSHDSYILRLFENYFSFIYQLNETGAAFMDEIRSKIMEMKEYEGDDLGLLLNKTSAFMLIDYKWLKINWKGNIKVSEKKRVDKRIEINEINFRLSLSHILILDQEHYVKLFKKYTGKEFPAKLYGLTIRKHLNESQRTEIRKVFHEFKYKLDHFICNRDEREINNIQVTPFKQKLWKILANM
jgi:hypothetical protein